jgi:hypothetical protein
MDPDLPTFARFGDTWINLATVVSIEVEASRLIFHPKAAGAPTVIEFPTVGAALSALDEAAPGRSL